MKTRYDPTPADLTEATTVVAQFLERGKQIANRDAYEYWVAEDLAVKRAIQRRADDETRERRSAIDECELCDVNGYLWRTATGGLVTFDDPQGETAYYCAHQVFDMPAVLDPDTETAPV